MKDILEQLENTEISPDEVAADKVFIAKYNTRHVASKILDIMYDELARPVLFMKCDRSGISPDHPRVLCSDLYDWFGDHIKPIGSWRDENGIEDAAGHYALIGRL